MKKPVNFIFSVEVMRKILVTAAFILAVGLISTSIWMIFDAHQKDKGMQGLVDSLKNTEIIKNSLKSPANTPDQEQISSIKSRVEAINKLKMTRSNALSELLHNIELAFPDGVNASKIEYSQDDGSLRIAAYASDAKQASELIKKLEASGMFKGVAIEKQSLRDTGANAGRVYFILKAWESR